MESSAWRSISSSCFLIIIIFLVFFAADARPLSSADTKQLSSTENNPLSHLHLMEMSNNKLNNKAVGSSSTKIMRRSVRNLGGPGSSPPRCYAKCGKCTPCRPVHVAVPPGTPVTAEYYPEAWRCKCGNKLYMP